MPRQNKPTTNKIKVCESDSRQQICDEYFRKHENFSFINQNAESSMNHSNNTLRNLILQQKTWYDVKTADVSYRIPGHPLYALITKIAHTY